MRLTDKVSFKCFKHKIGFLEEFQLPSEEELIAEIEREKNVLREQGVVYGCDI
ncbi:hypothetical protein [Sphingobacterium faecale]|uniref:Uncharacterized protein n=1 Tax=Sphingobacterium faecale TaxID=2803775 RepID=A0ABS1QZ80_9SPHI|nr:hypothetical protein [Sphingobacterium faecale]MBL1407505.1 hypothetical protein [Sphingobacterium faecale]